MVHLAIFLQRILQKLYIQNDLNKTHFLQLTETTAEKELLEKELEKLKKSRR